jgi:hypothetical protein
MTLAVPAFQGRKHGAHAISDGTIYADGAAKPSFEAAVNTVTLIR